MNKFFREHLDLEYTMDTANKTEKIAAPSNKHDDYCDSSVMAIHATLSMLPGTASVAGSPSKRSRGNLGGSVGSYSNASLFTTKQRKVRLNKRYRL
jgi:hypothetical protein